jgi:hypothetical protein
MKRFLAIYTGTQAALAEWNKLDDKEKKARESRGMEAWMEWGKTHAASIATREPPSGRPSGPPPTGSPTSRTR